MPLTNKLTLLNGFRAEVGLVAITEWTKSEDALDKEIIKAKGQAEVKAEAKKMIARKAEVDAMLVRLNNYLNPMGQKEVTEWKGTLDELSKRVAQARRDHKDMIDAEKKLARATPTVATLKPVKGKLAQKVEKIKAVAKIKNQPVAELGLLPRIAADLGLNPKVARAKLRKAFGAAWRNMNEKDIRKALA